MAQRPSLYVGCIGNKFMPGTWEAIKEAAGAFHQETGGDFEIQALHSLTVLPPMGLGAMHNFMVQRAYLKGFDLLLLIHNDVLLDDPRVLVKLAGRSKGYITPWFDQQYPDPVRLTKPTYAQGQGLLRLEWTVPYCAFFEMSVFRATGYRPFSSSLIYSEDEYDSTFFRCNGVDIWQDTDITVKLLRPPGLLAEALKERRVAMPEGPEDAVLT